MWKAARAKKTRWKSAQQMHETTGDRNRQSTPSTAPIWGPAATNWLASIVSSAVAFVRLVHKNFSFFSLFFFTPLRSLSVGVSSYFSSTIQEPPNIQADGSRQYLISNHQSRPHNDPFAIVRSAADWKKNVGPNRIRKRRTRFVNRMQKKGSFFYSHFPDLLIDPLQKKIFFSFLSWFSRPGNYFGPKMME